MISENEASLLLRNAIYAYCHSRRILVTPFAGMQAEYMYSDAELKHLSDLKMTESVSSWIDGTAKDLRMNIDVPNLDPKFSLAVICHLVDLMGGHIVMSRSEIEAISNREPLILSYYKDEIGNIHLKVEKP